MQVLRVYVDTSVFGGVFDDEFAEPSRTFFEQIADGRFQLLVSDVTAREISLAPENVADFFAGQEAAMTLISISVDILDLRDAYLHHEILGPASADDATHVAAATVGDADLIVSWNFKHIVHFEKIRQYNAVNALNGYHELDIRSPAEVIRYEDEDI